MMIVKQKFIKYILFIVIALSVIVIVLLRKHDDKEIADNVSLVEDVRMNLKNYLNLTDSVGLLVDSGFYGQYKVKPDEYIIAIL